MKPCPFIPLFIFTPILVRAQQFTEKVYLKDSVTIYEGYIIEQAPAKYIKIYRLKEKDTIQVGLTDVWKLTKNYITDSVKQHMPDSKQLKRSRYDKMIFAEFGGNGLLYSLNYDMRTQKGIRNKWGFRIGISKFRLRGFSTLSSAPVQIKMISIPFAVNYLFAKKRDFLELGMGATYLFTKTITGAVNSLDEVTISLFNSDKTLFNLYGTFNIGYRHMPAKKGLTWHVLFTPVFANGALLPFAGAGIGWHIK